MVHENQQIHPFLALIWDVKPNYDLENQVKVTKT